MKSWNSQRYKKEARQRNVEDEIVNSAILVGNKVFSNNKCLPIFTLSHLSKQSRIDSKKLDKVVMRRSISESVPNYRTFCISKNSNRKEKREINVPCNELMNVQKFINENILVHLPVHASVVSYKKGSKIYDAVDIHCNSKWLIKLDIKDFFDSVSEVSVYRVFRKVGYPALLSFQLARICTKVKTPDTINVDKQVDVSKAYSLGKYSNKRKGCLPQGAPTSPLLSNLVCAELDDSLQSLADEYDLMYSRYADDICFSTINKGHTRDKCIAIVKKAYIKLWQHGFAPNENKTKIVPPGARKVILGLVANGSKPKLTKSFKNNLLQHLHFCNRSDVGPAAHSKHRKFDSIIGFRNHLKGLIAYAMQIEQAFGNKVLAMYMKIKWPI